MHVTGTSAAVPEGQIASKSLASSSGELTADTVPGVSQRATSQRATSFVGTADYVAPEVMLAAHSGGSAAAMLLGISLQALLDPHASALRLHACWSGSDPSFGACNGIMLRPDSPVLGYYKALVRALQCSLCIASIPVFPKNTFDSWPGQSSKQDLTRQSII